jgi:hypothetical protein
MNGGEFSAIRIDRFQVTRGTQFDPHVLLAKLD